MQSIISVACVSLGSADTDIKGLLERIEALEARNVQQGSRIEQLEQQSISNLGEIQALHKANKALQDDIDVMSVESKQKDKNLSKLEKNIGDLMLRRRADQGVIKTLHTEMNKLERKISEVDNISRDYQQKTQSLHHDNNIKYSKTRENKNLNLNGPQKENEARKTVINTSKALDQSLNNTSNDEPQKVEFVTQTVNKTVHTGKQVKERATNIVAFHAVVSPHIVQNLGTHETIRFDRTLLNLGGGYHDQHGIFIAPKSGIYLISVSMAANAYTDFVADIMKDGIKLTGVLGRSEGYYDQSAVTILTQMDAGNEIWVMHSNPSDGSIWGNYYSSFTGILLQET